MWFLFAHLIQQQLNKVICSLRGNCLNPGLSQVILKWKHFRLEVEKRVKLWAKHNQIYEQMSQKIKVIWFLLHTFYLFNACFRSDATNAHIYNILYLYPFCLNVQHTERSLLPSFHNSVNQIFSFKVLYLTSNETNCYLTAMHQNNY